MNIKAWQVFVFSLLPLALVFAGVIVGSMWGVDSDKEVFQAPAAPPPGSGGGSPVAPPAGGTALTLVARNLDFDQSSLRAPPNVPVTVTLDNQDAGVLHNVGFYRSRTQLQPVAEGSVGPLFAGPGSQSFTFTSPAAGNYFFRCDVHPDTMTGSFIVGN